MTTELNPVPLDPDRLAREALKVLPTVRRDLERAAGEQRFGQTYAPAVPRTQPLKLPPATIPPVPSMQPPLAQPVPAQPAPTVAKHTHSPTGSLAPARSSLPLLIIGGVGVFLALGTVGLCAVGLLLFGSPSGLPSSGNGLLGTVAVGLCTFGFFLFTVAGVIGFRQWRRRTLVKTSGPTSKLETIRQSATMPDTNSFATTEQLTSRPPQRSQRITRPLPELYRESLSTSLDDLLRSAQNMSDVQQVVVTLQRNGDGSAVPAQVTLLLREVAKQPSLRRQVCAVLGSFSGDVNQIVLPLTSTLVAGLIAGQAVALLTPVAIASLATILTGAGVKAICSGDSND
jgi:hypothetical protein